MAGLTSPSSYASAKNALKSLDDNWFLPATSSARWMDLIGDYAGKEVFVIDGDALFQVVLDDQLLAIGRDGDPSFQILHAYYALERILLQFRLRSAEFEIVFWDVNQHSTLHTGASQFKFTSRALARSLLLKHLLYLQELDLGLTVSIFEDLHDPRWLDYRDDKKPMFIMTNDGGFVDEEAPDHVQETTAKRILVQRIFFFRVLHSGIPIALLKGAEYRDSKVLTFIYEQRRRGGALNQDYTLLVTAAFEALRFLNRSLVTIPRPSNLIHSSENAEELLIQVSRDMLDQAKSTTPNDITPPFAELQYLFIAFSLILPRLSLQDRARELDSLNPELLGILLDTFLPRLFATVSTITNSTQFKIDFDGRVFCAFLHYLIIHSLDGPLSLIGPDNYSKLEKIWNSLDSPVIDLLSFSKLYPSPTPHENGIIIRHKRNKNSTLLPFNNPVFQDHLGSLDIPVGSNHDTDVMGNIFPSSAFNGKEVLYQDTHHWHSKRPILSKRLGGADVKENEWLRLRKQRQEQRFMARLQSHATTLLGRNLEVIVIPPVRKLLKSVKEKPNVPSSHNKKKEKAPKLSSADKMRQKIAESKATSQGADALDWWREQLKTAPKTTKDLDRLFRNKKAEDKDVKLEMRMYRLHLEFLSWIDEPNADSDTIRDKYTVTIMRQVKEICEEQYITPKLSKVLKSVFKTLGFDRYSNALLDKCQCNPNAVSPNFKFKKLLSSSDDVLLYDYMRITESPLRWQLRLFGEYVDRSMDSAPDSRVPTFIPDAWQRQVLDSIDANNSLLVVAPTSAGKTFISFYAMEKVLRESDDGILVYIAPTKALVTQVAAEINARFKKDVPEGHVWAIHTRDHRIHDSSKCQILVTVPDVLTILLLSPPLARVWVPKIKWIILDEIHSIGQDGGAIWEQIILLAPSPIIGLSATIGSPENFNSWLESVQTVHGYQHRFICYPHRYSHLRKFYYDLSEDSATDADDSSSHFKGFSKHPDTGRTRFLHPISLLSFGPQVLPDDLALEARDTLTLYDSLAKLTPTPEGLEALNPDLYFQSHSAILRQRDVLEYEKELKDYVKKLLSVPNVHDPSTPISRVIRDLEDPKIACLDADQRLERLNASSLEAVHAKLPCFLADLHKQDKLPAILFNFDRSECEGMAQTLLKALEDAENDWRESDDKWKDKIKAWERWRITEEKRSSTTKGHKKAEREEEQHLGTEQSWEKSFNPDDPSPDFSFANTHKEFTLSKLDENIQSEGLIRFGKVPSWVLAALRRGIGIHHAGMNKGYRSLVESLFRSGFLRVIIATGTLALGINAPAKTCVFCGDSPFLTALMYRQCAGRAGRRGYDLLGNVYFYGISFDRVQRLVLSKLPPLGGSFPMTSTFTLRLFNLLEGSNYSDFAKQAIKSIMSLPHISFISDLGQQQLLHHLRFSIEYLRRGCLINNKGNPMGLFAIAAHLYYTEPSNFALVALIQSGVLHEIAQKPIFEAKKEFILFMSHLFGRRYLSKAFINQESRREFIKKSPSVVVLPDLPAHIYSLLNELNLRTLDIFTGYASVYSITHAEELGCDTRLPLSNTNWSNRCERLDTPFTNHLQNTAISVSVRSSFVATSGLDDQFKSVKELIATARSGLHLNEQTVPSFTPITSTAVESSEHCLNAYLFDFYIHGQQKALIDANGIRRGDLWHLLEDFTLTLKTVRLALGQLLNRSTNVESTDGFEDPQLSVDPAEVEDTDDEDERQGLKPTLADERDKAVYEMVSEATAEFDATFKKMWA